MDIVEFAETVYGVSLLEYQKKLLRKFQKMSDENKLRVRYQQEPVSPDKIDICPKYQGSGHWKKGERYDSTII